MHLEYSPTDIVKKRLQSLDIVPDKDSLLLGLSGGADSVALAMILKKLGFDVYAAHCNFHLRESESDHDEAFVCNFCRSMQIPLKKIDFNTFSYAEEKNLSIEMAARELRYQWFEKLRKELNIHYLVLAHHKDDNIETAILNIARGTGLVGLCAMPFIRDGYVVRPMLDISRRQIVDFLDKTGQTYCTDSTNADTTYRRNMVRHKLIPMFLELNPSSKDNISKMINNLQGVRTLLDEMLKTDKDLLKSKGIIPIKRIKNTQAPNTLLFELLNGYGFSPDTINRIIKDIDGISGAIYKGEGYTLIRGTEELRIKKNNELEYSEIQIPINTEQCEGEIMLPMYATSKESASLRWERIKVSKEDVKKLGKDQFVLPFENAHDLIIRNIRKGEKIRPFGMKGRKKISSILKDRKVPVEERSHRLILASGCTALWLIGDTTAADYPITSNNEDAILFTVFYDADV